MTLEDVFSKILREPVAKLSDETSQKSLRKWDSLRHIEIVSAVEKAFGVSFSTQEVIGLNTLGKFREALRAKGKEA